MSCPVLDSNALHCFATQHLHTIAETAYRHILNTANSLLEYLFACQVSLELHDTYKLGRLRLAQTSSAALPPLAQTSSAAIAAPKPALPEAALATLSGHTVAMAGNQPAHNPVKPTNSYLHYLYRTVATNLNSCDQYYSRRIHHFSVSPLTACTKS